MPGAASTRSRFRLARRSPIRRSNASPRCSRSRLASMAADPRNAFAVRQQEAVPRLAELKAFLEHALARISGKSGLAEAIRYALSRWPALLRYTTDGRLEMTNNAAERAIRPLTLGRKNWLFAGADSGGHRAAMIYTIIQFKPVGSTASTRKPICATSSPASPTDQ